MIWMTISIFLSLFLGMIVGSRHKYKMPWSRKEIESKYVKCLEDKNRAEALIEFQRKEINNLKKEKEK